MATPTAAPKQPPSICGSCLAQRPTESVTFNQNIGVVLMRFSSSIKGNLCGDCLEKHFWSKSLVTLFLGWWGIISFVVTPFFLLGNLLDYLKALRNLARKGKARGGPEIREPAGASSLALGVLSLPTLGLCGVTALGGIVMGLVGLVRSNRLGLGSRHALGGIAVNALLLVPVVAFVLAPTPSRRAAAGDTSGEAVFDEANARISSFHGESAFGNTPEAREMAKRFGEIMKVMSRVAFKGGRTNDSVSLTEGHFLTHVELRANSVCFLVHVPELRSYRGEVRKTLLDLAWTAAQTSTVKVRPEPGVKLAVALRGIVLYGALATGPATAEKPVTLEFEGSVGTAPLYAFFTGPSNVAAAPVPGSSPAAVLTPSPAAPTNPPAKQP